MVVKSYWKISIAVTVVICAIVGIFWMSHKKKAPARYTVDCSVHEKEISVESFSTRKKHSYKISENYYTCNKGDVSEQIIFTNRPPYLKKTKLTQPLKHHVAKLIAVPEDTISIQDIDKENFKILINNKVLQNSMNQDYVLSVKKFQSLKRLVKFKDRLPPNSYLYSDDDASPKGRHQFGLIHNHLILGKVTP